jgi:hypothetical protein
MDMTRRATLTAAAAAGLTLVAGIAEAEEHPRIRAAIRALQNARVDLEHADHDFGGHRVEAIRAVDVALDQLRQALRYDH